MQDMTTSPASVGLALLFLCALAGVEGIPAPSVLMPRQDIPIQSQPNSRPHCQTRGTCAFYSHCIESAFHCGTQGFTFSYAKKRCDVIKKLRPRRGHCNGEFCVSTQARLWARNTETCLHDKLEELLAQYPGNSHPDPQTCLAWEMDAIEELNSCYEEHGNAFLQLPENDIRQLVNLFRISDYYSPALETSLVQLLSTKYPTLAASLFQNHTLSSHRRILLCIKGSKYIDDNETTPTPEEYLRVVSDALAKEERDSFHYAGPDQPEDMQEVAGLCYDRSKNIDVNTLKNDYHLITWFTTNHSRDDIPRRDIRYDRDIQVNAVLFELTTRQTDNPIPERRVTQCGDGIRQLSEHCDFAGAYPGCTIDCEVREGHDCSVSKLEPSKCWKEVCGDGHRTRGEECDDGNKALMDGCDNSCTINSDTHRCSRVYNGTSHCVPLNTQEALQRQQQPPARLLSQSANPIRFAPSAVSEDPRTVLPASSAGYRLVTSTPTLILGMVVCVSVLR